MVSYLPCLKTTEAELRGYDTLTSEVKDGILPVFELTRSRRTSRNPHGDVFRKLEELHECAGSRPIIFDLTTHEELVNDQILALHDDANGFEAWRDFVAKSGLNAIPVIHAIEGGDEKELEEETRLFDADYCQLAFRLDAYDPNSARYAAIILGAVSSPAKVLFIVDGGYVEVGHAKSLAQVIQARVVEIKRLTHQASVACLSSSFPRSVVHPSYGGEDFGIFNAEEVTVHNLVSKAPGLGNIIYGDYGSVHPVKYPSRGGGWVPRIDFPLGDKFMYYRVRRDSGDYVTCAGNLVNDKRYHSSPTWGDEQITSAAAGAPNGRSPSFWISVRINLHIHKQFSRTLSVSSGNLALQEP